LQLNAFVQVFRHLLCAEYWKLLREIWMNAECPSCNKTIWLSLFQAEISQRDHLMEAADHDSFAALPARVRLFRGARDKKAIRGMSWTTDRDRGEWFANRYQAKRDRPSLLTCEIPKDRLLAYFVGRDENEAVIDPRRIPIEFLSLECRAPKNLV